MMIAYDVSDPLGILCHAGSSGCEWICRARSGVLSVTREPPGDPSACRAGKAWLSRHVGVVPRDPRDPSGHGDPRLRRARPPPGFPSTWNRVSRGAAGNAAPGLPVSEEPERGLPAAVRSWTRPGTPPSWLFPSGPGAQAAPAGGPSAPPDTWQLTVLCEVRAEEAVAGERLERTRRD